MALNQFVGIMPPMTLTTDNTNTDLLISPDLPPSSVCLLEATVLAKGQNDSSVCVAVWKYVFKRDGTGPATFVGTVVDNQVDNVSGNWFPDADAFGNAIHLYVNGAAATTVEWWGEMKITVLQLSSAM